MSALGQKRTVRNAIAMSAFPVSRQRIGGKLDLCLWLNDFLAAPSFSQARRRP
jgi:hypothetical protein